MADAVGKVWYCYIIENTATGRSYCGMTCSPRRRLRQHNREIKGGARATARGAGAWRFALLIKGFATQREALRAEWRIKHPWRGRWRGGAARARVGHLLDVLCRGKDEKWTSRSPLCICDTPLTVLGDEAYVSLIEDGMPVHRLLTVSCVIASP